MTEKEALREGYQSDIHHTNLSLGSGPASREALEVVWIVRACVCACEMAGAGVTPHAQNRGCRGGRRGCLLRCPGCHGAEWRGAASIYAGGTICFFRPCLTSICAHFLSDFHPSLSPSLSFFCPRLYFGQKRLRPPHPPQMVRENFP